MWHRPDHHESQEIRVLHQILRVVEQIYFLLLESTQSTTAVLSTGGSMATEAVLTFVDDSGNDAPPPAGDGSGIVVTFSSDNPSVTVGTATGSGDTATAPITGTDAFNLSATVANTSGADLVDDDGTTAFVQPTSIPVSASTPPTPQAVTAVLSTS